MSLKRCEIDIALTVRSPFLFQGLANGLMGIDTAQLRDEEGRPVIPADQVRGVLLEAMTDLAAAAPTLATADDIRQLFGQGSIEAKAGTGGVIEYDRPERSELIFADLVADGLDCSVGETTRVQIDEETGAVKTGHMQVIELVAPLRREVTFKGSFVAFLKRGSSKRQIDAIVAALATVSSIGAFKSAGFGEITKHSLTVGAEQDLALPAATSAPLRQSYLVSFDRPILVDAKWVADNAVSGAAIVPGAAFKGALAERLRRAGIDPESDPRFAKPLAAMRVSHAFPVTDAGDLLLESLPLSLVALKREGEGFAFGDALKVPYGRGATIDGEAALFSTDWKDETFSDAAKALGRVGGDPPSELPRTHTAIGPKGIAEDQRLFTTIARSTRGRKWLLTVDGGGDSPEYQQLVALLEGGLDGIGRTGARATLLPVTQPVAWPQPKCVASHPDLFVVVLRTPAMMTDPLAAGDAKTQYERYFELTCPDAMLENFYAAQRLAGRYLATRRRPYGATYYPFVLTEPGSTFLIKAKPGKTKSVSEKLAQLMRSGLPVVALSRAAPLSWRNCPFVPENGFGDITVDHMSGSLKLWEAVGHV